MNLFKCALSLVVLIGFVSVASASISATITGTKIGINYITGYDVTCTATSTKTNGAYMIFEWTQGETLIKKMTISKNAGKYVCTLPASSFITTGQWHVACKEYSSLDPLTLINGQSYQAQFGADNNGGTIILSVDPATYEYGATVTAEAAVSGITPVTFKWYRPGETTPIRTYTVSTYSSSGSTYSFVDTYSANCVGEDWKVTATQSVFPSNDVYFDVADDDDIHNFLITGDLNPAGSFILTEAITATVTSAEYDNDGDPDGVKMSFKWVSPSGITFPDETGELVAIDSNHKYTSTLPEGSSTEAGTWTLYVSEYDSNGDLILSSQEQFNTAESENIDSYSISGTQIGSDFVTGYDVTCSVYSPDVGGSYMIFDWYSPVDSENPVQSIQIYENDYYFICTLPASYFNTPGEWSIEATEYDSEGYYMETVNPEFTAVNNGGTISLSVDPATYNYGASVTAEAAVSGTTPVTFNWCRPGETTPIRSYTVSTPYSSSGSTYYYRDTYSDANVVGEWEVKATQSIYTDTETFDVSSPSDYAITLTGTTSTNGSFLLTEPVTATVTSTNDDGVQMKFDWYKPLSSSPFVTRYVTRKSDDTYSDILTDKEFTTHTGSWSVKVYELDSSDAVIKYGTEEFEAEGEPEFPIGSLVPLLLVGAIYIKVRRDTEGS